ncbi:MAG: alanine racemase [Bacilli bacterium]
MFYKTINLGAIRRNYQRCIDKTGKYVFPVIKANAYGCGIKQVVEALTKSFDIPLFCVSALEEAKTFLKLRTQKDILIFETPREKLIDNPHLLYSINNLKQIKAISHLNNRRVHIQIDLGHNRSDIKSIEDVKKAMSLCHEYEINVEGIYGHLRGSKETKAIAYMREVFSLFDVKYKHLVSSENYLVDIGNAIRIGSNLYGDGLDTKFEQSIELYTYASRIIHAKKGDTFGYYPGYTAASSCLLAELPIGYATGFLRNYTGSMLYCQNQLYPVVGAVSMNSLLVQIDRYIPKDAKFYLTCKAYPISYFAQNNNIYNPEVLLLFHPEKIIYVDD